MSHSKTENSKLYFLSIRGLGRLIFIVLLLVSAFKAEVEHIGSLKNFNQILSSTENKMKQKNKSDFGNSDKNGSSSKVEAISVQPDNFFSIPVEFKSRVAFWVNIYGKYTSDDAVFHDSQNLSIVYKVTDLRPIMNSNLHPFVKEFKVKSLIEKDRNVLLAHLRMLKKHLGKTNLTENERNLFNLLGKPKRKKIVAEAISNLRMQIGQKSFVEKALINSDLYLPLMEKIFEKKGLPKELTRIPFVESSFNLAARSRVGASGIWQIMPATGRKLMPNSIVDYRNDPIKATEFAAGLLKFNFKVVDRWPLAITAYNHGPTSISKLTKKYKTKDLPRLIEKVYGTHAFGFASSNFYACFLAILEVEKNREKYFPNLETRHPLEFSIIQLKHSIKYSQLLTWFDQDLKKAENFNPHIANLAKLGKIEIPKGTFLYIPGNITEFAYKDLPKLARKI